MDVNSFVIGFKKGKASAPPSSGGGGAELNIAYGDTPPEDTSKLWVKTEKPSGVIVEDVSGVFTYEEVALNKKRHSRGAGGAVGEYIYLFGGATTPWKTDQNTSIVRFDTVSDVFTTMLVTMSYPCIDTGFATVGSKIYIFGGYSSNTSSITEKKIYCYDTENETVTTLSARLPNAQSLVKAVPVGTNIILFGANTSDKTLVYSLDTETNELKTISFKMPDTYNGAGGVTSDGNTVFYVGGKLNSAQINKIDLENQTITPLESAFAAIGYCVGYVDGNIWVINSVDSKRAIQTLFIETGEVETLFLNYYNNGSVYVSSGKSIYIFDGLQGNDNLTSAIEMVQKITPPSKKPLAKNTLRLKPSLKRNKFHFIRSASLEVEIGVEMVSIGNDSGEAEPVEASLYKNGAWATI